MAVKASSEITLSCIVDVHAIYRYYKLQLSTLAPPATPTTRIPDGWTDTEPAYTSESTNNLYTVDLVVFSDETWSYSSVQLSSSYEAAKAAYNKAQTAQNGVNDINAGKPLFVTEGAIGVSGYVETIVITYGSDTSHKDKPIKFYMNQRGIGSYTITFAWENTSGIPAISYLTVDRKGVSVLAVKWSDYLCSLYICKTEAYDSISVMGIENPFSSNEMTVDLYTDNQSHSSADLISWTDKGYLMSWIDSECATNYSEFVSGTGLIIGDRRGTTLGKNVLIGNDSVDIRNGETVLASFGATELEFDEPVIFRSDGILLDNGDAFSYLGRNTVLWDAGASGYYMRASQTVTLSSNISRQVSGAVFAWSLYQNNQYLNTDWHFIFVPKFHVANYGGSVVRMYDAYLGMNKILYVSNGNVTGHDQNATSGTTNGVAWDNSKWILRYIVGV